MKNYRSRNLLNFYSYTNWQQCKVINNESLLQMISACPIQGHQNILTSVYHWDLSAHLSIKNSTVNLYICTNISLIMGNRLVVASGNTENQSMCIHYKRYIQFFPLLHSAYNQRLRHNDDNVSHLYILFASFLIK